MLNLSVISPRRAQRQGSTSCTCARPGLHSHPRQAGARTCSSSCRHKCQKDMCGRRSKKRMKTGDEASVAVRTLHTIRRDGVYDLYTVYERCVYVEPCTRVARYIGHQAQHHAQHAYLRVSHATLTSTQHTHTQLKPGFSRSITESPCILVSEALRCNPGEDVPQRTCVRRLSTRRDSLRLYALYSSTIVGSTVRRDSGLLPQVVRRVCSARRAAPRRAPSRA